MNPSIRNRKCLSRSQGFALVLVVTSLVLMTILAVSFLLGTTTELASARLYAQQMEAKRNSDMAINLALAQISAATSQGNASAPVAWASQPGMIRTWSGSSLSNVYRLYSSDKLKESGASFSPGEDAAALTGWKTGATGRAYNAIWCDLNSPITSSGNRIYPILTPPSTGAASDSSFGLNPSEIEGYSITSPPGFSGGSPGDANNPAPMPVRWIYVLQDGSMTAASGANTLNAPIPGASADNPIVARLAFWTDDETAKTNINTASEGSYWDPPITVTANEVSWGQNQPIQNEFQRYPGHPATVSLSAVFKGPSFPISTSTAGIYDLIPRIQFGGSQGGTQNTTDAAISKRMYLKDDISRFFTSAHEMAFKDQPLVANRRVVNTGILGTGNSAVVRNVSRRNFFITTHSRAPEVTMQNTPRISLWPITTDTRSSDAITSFTRMDAFDRTLAFSARLGGHDYFWKRANNWSSSFDYANITRNRQLYGYLRIMLGSDIPGYGSSFSKKYSSADADALATQMLDWSRSGPNLYGLGKATEIAGGKGTLTVNRGYASTTTAPTTDNNFPFGTNLGMVVPIRINDTKGTGSAIILSEFGYMLVCEKMELDQPSAGRVRYTFRPVLFIEASALKNDILGAFGRGANRKENYQLYVRFNGTDLSFTASGGGAGPAQTANLAMNRLIYYARTEPTVVWPAGTHMTAINPCWWFQGNTGGAGVDGNPGNFTTRTESDNGRPLVGDPIVFDFPKPPSLTDLTQVSQRNFNTSTQSWRINVAAFQSDIEIGFARSASDREVFQTGRVEIPAQAVPVPRFDYDTSRTNCYVTPPTATEATATLLRRYDVDTANLHVMAGDVVRTAEIDGSSGTGTRGDWRLASLKFDANPVTWFAPIVAPAANVPQNYGSQLNYSTKNSLAKGSTGPRLVANMSLNPMNDEFKGFNPPLASTNMNGALMSNGRPGDFVTNYASISFHDGGIFEYPVESHIGQGSIRRPYFAESVQDTAVNAAGDSFDTLQFTLLYSPNRQVYSPIQLGSLLTQVASLRPWQTLLFTPLPAAATGTGNGRVTATEHPGAGNPPDHLIADMFWMPAVDPVPLSENMATTGKINLNSRIEPFGGYINRDTALWAALKYLRIRTLNDADIATSHRLRSVTFSGSPQPTIHSLAVKESIDNIKTRFTSNDIYKSATEICEVPLVPLVGSSPVSDLRLWWASRQYTGDNLRERPYAYLQSVLTTKSNTYRIHWRVQALSKAPNSSSANWNETSDRVVSEYRGSTLVERYIDPNDTTIPDYATVSNPRPIHEFYKWRIVSNTQFNP
jgi:uncharacterized protein (TIGR02600 family)